MTVPRPLYAVEHLFRDKSAFAGLPHVIALISEFLDCSVDLTLAAASKFGSRKLLDRIWDSCQVGSPTSPRAWSPRNYLRTDRHYLQFQFRQSLLEALKTENGYARVAEWLFGHCTDCHVPVEVVEEAAELGKLNMLKLFHKIAAGRANLDGGGGHPVHWGGRDAEKAARQGHSNVVWWLLVHAPAQRDVGKIMAAAVESGDIPLMEWLMRNEFNSYIHDRPKLSVAVRTGSLEVIKWMYDHGFTEDGVRAVIDAVAWCGLEIISWLLEHEIGCDATGVFISAIQNNDPEIAKTLVNKHFELVEAGGSFDEAMLSAANSGELKVVQWLFSEFSDHPDIDLFGPVNVYEEEPSTVLDAAAESGNLELVEYFHNLDLEMKALKYKRRKGGKAQRRGGTWGGHGITCTTAAMDFAARDGNLDVLRWLHHNRSEGCTTSAMDSAAGGGDLETIQWLHENRKEGCTVQAMNSAAANGHLRMVNWLHQHRSEGCTSKAMDLAARNGHLHVVKWLSEQRKEGCTTAAMDGAATNGHLHIMKWLHRHRAEGCTTKAIDGAAERGFLNVVRWLHSNRTEGWTRAALLGAAVSKHFEVLLFLHSQQNANYCSMNIQHRNYMLVLPEIRQWALENYPDG